MPTPTKPRRRKLRFYRDLPLGTRFRYRTGGPVWTILEHHGYGLVARWNGLNSPGTPQSICSFLEDETKVASTKVEVVEFDEPKITKRMQAAENVCRELRQALTGRVAEQDWSRISPMLTKWMKLAPKALRYSRPQ